MIPRRLLATILLVLAAPLSALAGECPLSKSLLEPIDAPGSFTMHVEREGHGYRFALTSLALRLTTRFVGSYQNGTGHLVLDEEAAQPAADDAARPEAVSSRALVLRANLRTTDPWSKGAVPIAYAAFEGLSTALWERARFLAEDDRSGSVPPDGLWRVLRCAPR